MPRRGLAGICASVPSSTWASIRPYSRRGWPGCACPWRSPSAGSAAGVSPPSRSTSRSSGHEHIERTFADVESASSQEPLRPGGQGPGPHHLRAAVRGRGQSPRPKVQGSAPARGRSRRRPGRRRRDRFSARRAGRHRCLLFAAQRRLGLGQYLPWPAGRPASGRGRAPEEGAGLCRLGRIGARDADRRGHRRRPWPKGTPSSPSSSTRRSAAAPGPRNSPRSPTSSGSITARPRPSTRRRPSTSSRRPSTTPHRSSWPTSSSGLSRRARSMPPSPPSS